MERHKSSSEIQKSADKLYSLCAEKYGSDLGVKFFKYTYPEHIGYPDNLTEFDYRRDQFAGAIIKMLETGDHHEKVKALTALMESFEAKLEKASQEASKGNLNLPIG